MKCEICNSPKVWTWRLYFKASIGSTTCSACGTKLKLKRNGKYWIWLGLFFLCLFPIFAIYTNIVFYVAEAHPGVFRHGAFKLGFSAFCGFSVFLAFIVPDKYFLSKWGSLGAKAT